jgi:hypothetical protein
VSESENEPAEENDELVVRFTERDAWWQAFAGDQRGERHFVPAGTPIPPPGTTLVDGRLAIRLAPEYGATTPLWPQTDGDAVNRFVPPELLERLIRWQALFEDNFDWESGWRSDRAKEQWAAEAIEMEHQVREALNGRVDLIVDLWPLD